MNIFWRFWYFFKYIGRKDIYGFQDAFNSGDQWGWKYLLNYWTKDIINSRDDRQNTPLIWAAVHGHADVVKALIEKGADLNIRSANQQTNLLIWASVRGYVDIVTVLIDTKANLNFQTANEHTALFWAAEYYHVDVVTALIKGGAKKNITIRDMPLLTWAAKNGYTDVVKALIDAKADITIKSEKGKTALDCALENNKCTSAAILLKHSSLEVQENFKNTCTANKQDNIIYKSTTSDIDLDYVGAYKILEVLFEKFEDQINFLEQIDIRPDHEFVSLLMMADKYKVSPTVIYSCFDKFKDIEKTEKVISKEVKLIRQMGEVSYREVTSLSKILLTAQLPYIPKEVLANIASHDIAYDQKFAEALEKSREEQPAQCNIL